MEDFLQMNSDILSIFVIIERIFSSIYGFMYVLSSFLFEVCSNVANFSEKVFVLSSKGFFFFNPLYFHDMQMLYFILPPILFLIGVFGICFFTQNFIIFVMCLEVIALASFLNFILFSLYLNNPIGQLLQVKVPLVWVYLLHLTGLKSRLTFFLITS